MSRILIAISLACLAANVPAEPLPLGAHSRADELRLRRADADVARRLESERIRLETERLRMESARLRLEYEKIESQRRELKSRYRF
jgi:hypothetical protein